MYLSRKLRGLRLHPIMIIITIKCYLYFLLEGILLGLVRSPPFVDLFFRRSFSLPTAVPHRNRTSLLRPDTKKIPPKSTLHPICGTRPQTCTTSKKQTQKLPGAEYNTNKTKNKKGVAYEDEYPLLSYRPTTTLRPTTSQPARQATASEDKSNPTLAASL